MAECLLRYGFAARGQGVDVQSAGLGAMVGYPADEQVQLLMRRRGLDLSEHRAVQVNRDMLRWAELILVMEESHRARIRSLEPSISGKVMLLGHWTGDEVADPYGEELAVFEQTQDIIEKAVASWLDRLQP